GTTQTATTEGNGAFTLPVLPVGHYRLTVDQPGFAQFEVKDVDVEIGAKVNIPVTLAPAGTTQQVEVTDRAPVVDTTQTQVASTVNARSVENLPVNGRNFLD